MKSGVCKFGETCKFNHPPEAAAGRGAAGAGASDDVDSSKAGLYFDSATKTWVQRGGRPGGDQLRITDGSGVDTAQQPGAPLRITDGSEIGGGGGGGAVNGIGSQMLALIPNDAATAQKIAAAGPEALAKASAAATAAIAHLLKPNLDAPAEKPPEDANASAENGAAVAEKGVSEGEGAAAALPPPAMPPPEDRPMTVCACVSVCVRGRVYVLMTMCVFSLCTGCAGHGIVLQKGVKPTCWLSQQSVCFHVVSVVLYADKATRGKGRPLDIWVQQTSKIVNTQAVRYWRQVEIEGMRTSTRL